MVGGSNPSGRATQSPVSIVVGPFREIRAWAGKNPMPPERLRNCEMLAGLGSQDLVPIDI
jgi:hypothetical protein